MEINAVINVFVLLSRDQKVRAGAVDRDSGVMPIIQP